MMQNTTSVSGRWTGRCVPAPPVIRDYAGQRYYYCPTCGRMVYQPGAEKCDVVGCGQMLDWSWWRAGYDD